MEQIRGTRYRCRCSLRVYAPAPGVDTSMEQISNFLILKELDRFSFNIIPRPPLRPDHPLFPARPRPGRPGSTLAWNKRLGGAFATRGDCSMDDERDTVLVHTETAEARMK